MAPSPLKRPKKSVAIGIDLGTSKCCVAAVRDGRAHVLENEFGQRTTPSWVAFNSQQRLVGGAALDQAVVNCANTVSAVKRTLGRTYDELRGYLDPNEGSAGASVERLQCFPQGCTNVKGRAGIIVDYRDAKMVLFPEDIAVALISKMKSIVETKLECSVVGAVVSVPTCFNNSQRKAVKTAAEVAGLGDVVLINETSAVALDYASTFNFSVEETVLVVDFGAGKLDVALVAVKKDSIEVLATSGDSTVGGCDVDIKIVDHAVHEFYKTHGHDLKDSSKALLKLFKACEKVKRTLSLLPEAILEVDNLFGDIDFSMKITRKTFSSLIHNLHDYILSHIHRCCSLRKVEFSDVDKVLLVGGSTRVVGLEKSLLKHFTGKISKTVNVEECVASGAALYAGLLSGSEDFPRFSLSGITSHAIMLLDLDMSEQIPKGTKLPYRMTVKANSLKPLLVFEISCIHCPEELCAKCNRRSVGNFLPLNAGCEIEYLLENDGILSVCVHDEKQWECMGELIPSKEDHEFNAMLKQRTTNFDVDIRKETERVQAMVDAEELAYKVKDKVEVELLKQIRLAHAQCNDVLEWINNHPDAPKKDYVAKHLKLKRLVKKHKLKVKS